MYKYLLTLLLFILAQNANASSSAMNAAQLSTRQIVHVMLVLAAIIAIIFLCAFIVRRFTHFNKNAFGAIKILTSLSVGSRERLMIIQVADKQLLVGVSAGGIHLVHAFDEPVITPTPSTASSTSFKEQLTQVIKGIQR